MKLTDSPITQHHFHGHAFFLKRDDLLHSHFSGNKARKFMAILDEQDPTLKTLVSYGSVQSNAMYSLAALAKIKGWAFEYYVSHIPAWLKTSPLGNYRGALDLGMRLTSMQEVGSVLHPREYIQQVRGIDETSYFVPEGGSLPLAEAGVKQLAMEIIDWTRYEGKKEFVVALPSGTGTTALYLHKHLRPHDIEVLTCPCVGDAHYLTQQFKQLGEDSHPTILTQRDKHHFGRLYASDYATWQALSLQTDVEFDLLYDPYMWQCLLPWLADNPHKVLIYLHQGGLLGNESMLPRYRRQFEP
ncbi:1-aminocyclopropane-1-carboxylate deaminase/D-cysteine desulfhydrase [Vibrio sp. CAU 1672]|uniref:1-aminocyclopropane-1-carboxylate deaminase/D-cysteine desulfhydrase n=1 Tax=Vibrio sp. CAU 1672 TaxID=3032594 RepID=UPI0023D985AE|nr:1-aminocyclopropane-1-carboxylate deaminase/D-cysteine desulfhydrase [Vibrio sp. CAU 1672]MDF2154248.1 1-aminocyclopropane-1-carboxylate deaminase/D-cysteine desulfhydrase [Vibrio sp. CAU 1672]